jgi:hypothetical protein
MADLEAKKFDMGKLILPQNYEESGGAQKVIVRVAVRKPNRNEFFRVHPDGENYSFRCALVEDPDNRDVYVMAGELADQYPDLCRPVKIVTAINRTGNPFLWPLKMPTGDRRGGAWIDSALQASEYAKKKWVKIMADMSAGQYSVFKATGNLEEPDWPDLDFNRLMEMAFDGFVIDDRDHPLIQRLTGKI